MAGECVCESRNWAGSLCDRCSEKFYGARCEPLIRVLQIAPNRGPDVGGTLAHVLGHNFMEPINAFDYRCKSVLIVDNNDDRNPWSAGVSLDNFVDTWNVT